MKFDDQRVIFACGPSASQTVKRFAEERGGRCYYCGRMTTTIDMHSDLAATRDHLVPKSRGGALLPRNLVLACRRCNELRGHSNAEAFKRLMFGEAVTRDALWPHLFTGRKP